MQQQNDPSVTRFYGRAFQLVPLILGLLLTAACTRPLPVQPIAAPGGGCLIKIGKSGPSRIQLRRERRDLPWEAFSMRNAGAAPIRDLKFWGAGRFSLIVAPGGGFKTEDVYNPFSLLPGEEFALSAPQNTNQVFGIFNWQTPQDVELLKGSVMRSRFAQINQDGTIILSPGKSEAWIQFELSAPLSDSGFRIAWEAEPAPVEPQIWINLDGDVWTSLPRLPNQPRVDWMHPIDLSTRVAGYRRFWIRLEYKIPQAGSHESGRPMAPPSLLLRRIRIDREVQGPGRLRTWRAGTNEFDISLQSEKIPELEIWMRGAGKH